MTSRKQAAFNILLLMSLLAVGLLYSILLKPRIPGSIVVPTAGGGLMNLGFWLFYNSTIAPIQELKGSVLGKQNMFLFSAVLHLFVILIFLVFDMSWISEMLP